MKNGVMFAGFALEILHRFSKDTDVYWHFTLFNLEREI